MRRPHQDSARGLTQLPRRTRRLGCRDHRPAVALAGFQRRRRHRGASPAAGCSTSTATMVVTASPVSWPRMGPCRARPCRAPAAGVSPLVSVHTSRSRAASARLRPGSMSKATAATWSRHRAFTRPGIPTPGRARRSMRLRSLPLGIAFWVEHELQPLIDAGKLVPLLQDFSAPFPGFYICGPSTSTSNPASSLKNSQLYGVVRPGQRQRIHLCGCRSFGVSGRPCRAT